MEKPERTCPQKCGHCLTHNACVECVTFCGGECKSCTLHPYNYWRDCCVLPVIEFWLTPIKDGCVKKCIGCRKRCERISEGNSPVEAPNWRKWQRVCCSMRTNKDGDKQCYCFWNTPLEWSQICVAFIILYIIYACWMIALMLIYLAAAGYLSQWVG